MPMVANTQFYSQLISAAQRLPNGNTMITEGCANRIFEVTHDKEVVWEYIAPFDKIGSWIYRAYRYPYDYVPQLAAPEEIPVVRLNNQTFRVPGAAEGMLQNKVAVEGAWGYERMDACVTEDDSADEDDIKAKF